MSIAETDWQSLLLPDSDLPPDVFFLVQGEKIGAHKLFLAGVSPVFKGMLYGLMRETADEIKVEETTFEAFDTVIKYIYHPNGGEPFNLNHVSCPQSLFELLSLATKYQLLNLTAMTSEALESLTLTRGNMIFTASVAKNYERVFSNQSTKLMMKCVKFLLDPKGAGGDILALVKDTKEQFPEANFEILNDLRVLATTELQLPDWGYLVFFDTEVHQIPRDLLKTLAIIPKLEAQWKIIHDFKPTEYFRGLYLSLGIRCGGASREKAGIVFWPSKSNVPELSFSFWILSDEGLPTEKLEIKCNKIPPIGEWTRMEISHEKEDGKYFLSFSIGGTEVGRKEVALPMFRDRTNVKVTIGSSKMGRGQPGFIRGLVVLQKE